MAFWNRTRRRQELLAESFSETSRATLRQHVRHYSFLSDAQRRRLEDFVKILVAEKDWVGGSGFQLTEAMKVTISGYAGIMTIGLEEPYYFDRLMTIIVYPGAYMPHSRFEQHMPLGASDPRLGESWQHGPIVLSWSEIVGDEKRRPGNNLVIHEFAHHVDSLDGDVDGSPPLVNRQQGREWYRVSEAEFARLRSEAASGQATLLDRYGAKNRAEFFAVASECFFERPHALSQRHPELYQVLAAIYRQDLTSWLP
ncbi:MAG TPA: M90 family metallopeptidase, partial [Pirellulales bacterium]